MEYSITVLDHYRNPRNVGELPGAHCVGTAGNPDDGDFLRLAFSLEEDRISQVCFQTLGCPAAIAAGSAATVLLQGKTVQEALAMKNMDVVEFLDGLPESKLDCSVLAQQATQAALGTTP
jgi:nitrogen fixation NifU-like protein